MKNKIYAFFIILYIITSCNNSEIKSFYPQSENKKSTLPEGSVRLKVISNRLVVDVKVNDTICQFEFDSGSPSFCLSNKGIKKLKIEKYSKSDNKININSLVISGDSSCNIKASIDDGISDYDGLIGFNLEDEILKKRTWEFSISNNYLKIWDANISLDYSNKIIIPFEVDKRWSVLTIKLDAIFSGNSRVVQTNYKYLLDTGTPYFAVITRILPQFEEFLNAQPCIDRDIPPKFIHKLIYVNNVTLPLDTVGIDSITISRTFFGPRNVDFCGTIGMEFIKHYDFYVDFNKQIVVLSKNNLKYPIPSYRKNNLGFDIKHGSNGICKVLTIYKQSNAEKAGIKLNDIILSINGVNEFTKQNIVNLKRISLNKPLNVIIKRDSDTLYFNFEPTKNFMTNW